MTKRQRRGGKGRRPLRIQAGFGRFIYEAIILHRRADGLAWSVADLAAAMKHTPAAVRAWVGGTVPRPETWPKLAEVLGVTTADLLEAAESPVLSVKSQATLLRLYERTLRGQPTPGQAVGALVEPPVSAETPARAIGRRDP